MTTKRVLTEEFTQYFVRFAGGDALFLHDALDDDVPGQQTYFRSLVHVVGEVAIVAVPESL